MNFDYLAKQNLKIKNNFLIDIELNILKINIFLNLFISEGRVGMIYYLRNDILY